MQRFVGFQEEAVFGYAPPDAWPTIVAAVTDLAAELRGREIDGQFFDSAEPWWERTDEATADPLDRLDPSISGDLAAALLSATQTLTRAAEQLVEVVRRQDDGAFTDDEDDDGAPF